MTEWTGNAVPNMALSVHCEIVVNIRHVEMIQTVARVRSLGGAARELGITQPRVSQVLQQVEAKLGRKLFRRSQHGLELTPEGEVFLPYTERITGIYTEAIDAIAALRSTDRENLRIGLSPATSSFIASWFLEQFHRQFPKVHVTLSQMVPPQLRTGLESSALDICISYEQAQRYPFEWETLLEAEFVGLSSSRTNLPPKMTLEDFAKQPLLLRSRLCSTRRALDRSFRRVGIKPNISMEIDDNSALIALVEKGIA